MSRTKFESKKRQLVALKIYFDRARMYLGYINFFMLNIVLINSFDNPVLSEFIANHKNWFYPVLFAVFLSFLILVGFLDTKLGVRQEELRNNASRNPILVDMTTALDKIQKDINELKSK